MLARCRWSALLRSRNGSSSSLGTEIFNQFFRDYNAIHALQPCTNVHKNSKLLEVYGTWFAYKQNYVHRNAISSGCKSGTGERGVARTFASKASKEEKPGDQRNEDKKDISTVEDPFDAPTYNIPQKPVTFAEGASYSLIILAGLGVAAAAGYAVFKELIFEPKEYKVFNKALKRIQDDSQVGKIPFFCHSGDSFELSFRVHQVRVRIGSPITGYGQESRNRAARQRIANKIFTDEDGVEHIQVGFYIRGPHGAGKVAAEMFKDKDDKQWKYTYLIVQITQPYQSQLILESYIPAPAPVAS